MNCACRNARHLEPAYSRHELVHAAAVVSDVCVTAAHSAAIMQATGLVSSDWSVQAASMRPAWVGVLTWLPWPLSSQTLEDTREAPAAISTVHVSSVDYVCEAICWAVTQFI